MLQYLRNITSPLPFTVADEVDPNQFGCEGSGTGQGLNPGEKPWAFQHHRINVNNGNFTIYEFTNFFGSGVPLFYNAFFVDTLTQKGLYTGVEVRNGEFAYVIGDVNYGAVALRFGPNGSRMEGQWMFENLGNTRAGLVTLTGSNTSVSVPGISSSKSLVQLTRKTRAGTPGELEYTVQSGVGFTIKSTSSGDTSEVGWAVIQIP